jgi:hypothetical protein
MNRTLFNILEGARLAFRLWPHPIRHNFKVDVPKVPFNSVQEAWTDTGKMIWQSFNRLVGEMSPDERAKLQHTSRPERATIERSPVADISGGKPSECAEQQQFTYDRAHRYEPCHSSSD